MHGQNINLPMCVCVCVCVSVTLSVNSPTSMSISIINLYSASPRMWRMSKITEIRKRNCSENRFGNRPVGVKYVQGGYREAQLIRRGKKPSSLKVIRNGTEDAPVGLISRRSRRNALHLTLYGHIKTVEQRTINTVMVHWPLMGGLLHLVQRGGAWAGCGPARPLLAVPNVTATHQRPVYKLHIIRYGTNCL